MQFSSNMIAYSQDADQVFPIPECEKLLSRLCIDVEWFNMLGVGAGEQPVLPAVDQVIILYVVKGTGSLQWPGGAIALREGMIVAIPTKLHTILHGGHREVANDATGQADVRGEDALADGADSLLVASSVVTASAGHGLGYFVSLRQPLVEDTNDAALATVFGAILTELGTRGIGSKCLIEALMKQVLIVLLRRTIACETAVNPLYLTIANPSLALVINTIQDRYAQHLSIPGLAGMVGMTSYGLTREFERVFGESLLDYIHQVRLCQATDLLTQTDLPIKSIAATVGFGSRSHFSRAFRKRQGEDPTSFRKKVLTI